MKDLIDTIGPFASFADADGNGHWVTIGGRESGGERHGGSPVFIRDGVIVKGAPALTGKRIDALHEEAGPVSKRMETSRGKEYARAVHAKAARAEGINPQHLHQLAGQIIAHDREFVEDRRRVLKDSRDALSAFTGGHINAVHAAARRGQDAASIPGLDEVAEDMAKREQHLFKPDEHPSDTLFSMLKEGVPQRMSEDAAYEQAKDVLRQHVEQSGTGGRRSMRRAAKREPLEDAPFSSPDQERDNRGRWTDGGGSGSSGGTSATAKPLDETTEAGRTYFKAQRQQERRDLFVPQMNKIAPGEAEHVGGHLIRRVDANTFRTETDRGFKVGTVHDAADYIHQQLEDQRPDRKRILAAKDRAASTPPAQLFTPGYDREQKAFASLPGGTRVLITDDGGHGGRIGTVVREGLATKVKLDNSPGLRTFTAASVEPLDVRLSWRSGEVEEPRAEASRQMSMVTVHPPQSGAAGGTVFS